MSSSRKKVILDLDQTLISAEATEEYDAIKNRKKAKKFSSTNMESFYVVFERPGLQEFLDFLFEEFDVSIWTAASKDYALFVIEHIIIAGKPNRTLEWIFFSYHCDISKKYKGHTKDLTVITDVYKIPGYSLDNTFIIDDYDEVYNTQKENCVIAPAFEFEDDNSDKDKFLVELKTALKKYKKAGDINRSLKTLP